MTDGPSRALHSCGLSSEDLRALGKGQRFQSRSRSDFPRRQRHAPSPLQLSLCCLSEKWQLIDLLMKRRNN